MYISLMALTNVNDKSDNYFNIQSTEQQSFQKTTSSYIISRVSDPGIPTIRNSAEWSVCVAM